MTASTRSANIWPEGRDMLRRVFAAVCVVCGLLNGPLARGQVMIQPTVLELSGKQRVVAVSVTLSDRAVAPMRLQAEVMRWSQDMHGDPVTEPTEQVLVSPPIADLRPGQRQVFRVAMRGPRASASELTYRLILEDVAEAAPVSGDQAIGLTFRMRYDLPLLVAPAGPVIQALQWKSCAPTSGINEACLHLLNAGNRRIKLQTVTVNGQGWQRQVLLGGGENLLAGTQREWHVPLAAGQAGTPRTVQTLTASGETIQAEPGGF
jgi:fimbrial chaperone protein